MIIQGRIYSASNIAENVHIFNLTKKSGTISNDLGLFQIKVSINDTLYISSIQYNKKFITITKQNMEARKVEIELTTLVNALDEVFLKHLTGSLSFDIANKPKDTIPAVGYTFKRSDLNKKPPYNEFEGTEHPNAQDMTDPIGAGAGVGIPDKRYQQLLKLKREIARKKEFPETIKKHFSIEYFTITLKIPEEKINHFISYCEYRNIIEKYYDNKQLEVIEILKEESKNYHAITK